MADAAGSPTKWFIGDEEKSRHITVFYSLNPENGVLLGERCRELFVQSKLSSEDLSHIWRISDVDGDGALNVGEFTVAMHLINAKLSGCELPRGLPPSIRPCMDKMIPGVTSKDYETYVKAFHELDKNQTGSLTAEEAKPVFIKSQLLTGHLAHVWNLADYDHDGTLTVNEFVIATHLMRFLKSGNQLPSVMDVKALLPEQVKSTATITVSSHSNDETARSLGEATLDQTDSGSSKSGLQRGKWMTFSARKMSGMFRKGEQSKQDASSAAFSPVSGNHSGNADSSPTSPLENPFATDAFVPVDHQARRVSVTSLDSTTSIEPFEEDPFKNCDPFSNSFPAISEDPFEMTANDPFSTEAPDPFSTEAPDPFSDSKSDPFASSSATFGIDPFANPQTSHPSSAAVSQTSVEESKSPAATDKFESAFGDDDGFLNQKTMAAGGHIDPFTPTGTKPVETFGNENPFEGDAFVQVQHTPKTDSDPFSVSGHQGVSSSDAQLMENPFGTDSFSSQMPLVANQATDPFGVVAGESQRSVDNPFGDDMFQPSVSSALPSNVSDELASSKVAPSGSDPFAQSTTIPAVKDNSPNPFELDSFVKGWDPKAEQVVESTKQDADVQSAEVSLDKQAEEQKVAMAGSVGDHHVKFPDDSRIAVTFETYSSEEYARKDSLVDPHKAEVEVIREEHRTLKHGLDDVEQKLVKRLSLEREHELSDPQRHHVKFSEDIDTVPTYSSEEYARKDSEVDPHKAEVEVIREEHRTLKHGLDDVEQKLLKRLSLERDHQLSDPEQQRVKFSEDTDTIPTYTSDEYDRRDTSVDPEKAAEEVCKETGKRKLTPQDSVSSLLKAKRAQEERRRKQVELQQQLIAEIDLEWEEKERTVEYQVQEAKEEARRKFLADTQAAQQLEQERWQQKLKEREEEQKRAEQEELAKKQKELEQAERKAAEEEMIAADEKKKEEERQRQEARRKEEEERREQEAKQREQEEQRMKEEMKRQAEEENKAKAEREKTQQVTEDMGEAEEQKEAPKGRRGLAARWEALAGGQKQDRVSRQNYNEALERRKREEAELLRRQQEHEEEKRKRSELATKKEQERQQAAMKQKQIEEEKQRQQEEEERRHREKEEEEKQMKKTGVQIKPKKHALAKQWEEKFNK